MAKAGMKRPEPKENKKRNDVKPVPEIQGKAKQKKDKAGPM